MNALKMDLTGKKVIVSAKYYKGTEKERTFTCKGGFGCVSFTSGNAIFGEFDNGEKARIEGYQVEKLAKKGSK